MKKILFSLIALSMIGIFLSSCNESEELNDISSTEDMTLIEDVLNSIEESADETTFALTEDTELESRGNPCVEKTSTAPLGQYPNTITLDFGDGCEGPHGRVRKGKIIIDISDKMHNEGAVRIVSFDEFFVDEVQVTGSRSITNNGQNDEGNTYFTKEVTGIQLIFPNGEIASRDALHIMTFLEGYDTPQRFDNVMSISGNASGVSRSGVEYSAEIVEDLIKRGNCRWIVSGIKEITRDDQTVSLDYGDGACNRAAVVTFEDGSTKEINLYRKWWK